MRTLEKVNDDCYLNRKMGIDLHGGSDTGVADGFGEGCQIEVGIVLMLDVVVGRVSVL